MFGAQHGGDLPQVGSVALLLHAAGEGDGDDSLCDVDQVQLVALLQGLQQTSTPVAETKMHLFNVTIQVSGPTVQKQKLMWTAGLQ